MTTLYMIGNGFDLQHGLPTRYWDFQLFLKRHNEEFLRSLEEDIWRIRAYDFCDPRLPHDAEEKWENGVKNSLWRSFETRLGEPDADSIIGFSSKAAEGLNERYGATVTESTMNAYWKKQYGYVTELQTYVKKWAESIDLSATFPIKMEMLKNDKDIFLNFNYLNTLETVYHIPSRHVIHIHGGLLPYCSVSPIMGHGNHKKYKNIGHMQWKTDALAKAMKQVLVMLLRIIIKIH